MFESPAARLTLWQFSPVKLTYARSRVPYLIQGKISTDDRKVEHVYSMVQVEDTSDPLSKAFDSF